MSRNNEKASLCTEPSSFRCRSIYSRWLVVDYELGQVFWYEKMFQFVNNSGYLDSLFNRKPVQCSQTLLHLSVCSSAEQFWLGLFVLSVVAAGFSQSCCVVDYCNSRTSKGIILLADDCFGHIRADDWPNTLLLASISISISSISIFINILTQLKRTVINNI